VASVVVSGRVGPGGQGFRDGAGSLVRGQVDGWDGPTFVFFAVIVLVRQVPHKALLQ
jgi:hypothetical protein